MSSVAMPPFALSSKRNMDAYIHCSVTLGKEKRNTNSDTFPVYRLLHKLEKEKNEEKIGKHFVNIIQGKIAQKKE